MVQYQPLQEKQYVQRAEEVIQSLRDPKRNSISLTTSQIRNILSMVNEIYNQVVLLTGDTLTEEQQSQLRYMKIKLIYAAGRHTEVKNFLQQSQLVTHLDHIGDRKADMILFARYLEALVAYHKFYGGRD